MSEPDLADLRPNNSKTLLAILFLSPGALDVLNGTLGKKLENSASYHLHAINKRVDIEERLKNHTEVARYYSATWVFILRRTEKSYRVIKQYTTINTTKQKWRFNRRLRRKSRKMQKFRIFLRENKLNS